MGLARDRWLKSRRNDESRSLRIDRWRAGLSGPARSGPDRWCSQERRGLPEPAPGVPGPGRCAWVDNPGDGRPWIVVRKLAGIAVHCLEDQWSGVGLPNLRERRPRGQPVEARTVGDYLDHIVDLSVRPARRGISRTVHLPCWRASSAWMSTVHRYLLRRSRLSLESCS